MLTLDGWDVLFFVKINLIADRRDPIAPPRKANRYQ